jgi:hypothetical protein
VGDAAGDFLGGKILGVPSCQWLVDDGFG